MNQAARIQSVKTAGQATALSGYRVLGVLLLGLWVPLTVYLLLFAPLPMVHDAVHPVRHAFSFIMCH